MRKRKLYHELTFTDDFMFWKVMEAHPELGKEVLELILGHPIGELEVVDGQKTCKVSYDSRGIRMDVFVVDDRSRFYDVEMQAASEPQLPKRMRYYGDVIDMSDIQTGADYEDLKETYIIFICLKDPFEKNLPLYEFRTTCLQDPTVAYDDAVRRIVVNAGCTRKDVPEGLKTFFSFLKNGKGKDPLTNRLADAVAKAISRDDWRVEYMKFEILLSKERKEGREEGLTAGRQEGKILERVKTLRRFHVSDEDIIAEIMRDFGLSREDAEEYMKSE